MSTVHTILPNDKELFQRVVTGDMDAFDIFYHRHFDGLYRTAFRRLQNREICRDILQEVFADFWKRREQINNDNPVAYLHTAVRFQVFKAASRSEQHVLYEPFDEMRTVAPTTIDALYYKDLVQLIELWIETLPEKRREIFRLHYKEHLSTQVIAEKLAISQKTVQNQLGIAFSDLRGKLPDVAMLILIGAVNYL